MAAIKFMSLNIQCHVIKSIAFFPFLEKHVLFFYMHRCITLVKRKKVENQIYILYVYIEEEYLTIKSFTSLKFKKK